MTDIVAPASGGFEIRPRRLDPAASAARTRKRYRSELRLKLLGLAAILTAVGLLGLLLVTIVSKGYTAFVQTYIALEIDFDPEEMGLPPDGPYDQQDLRRASYSSLVNDALYAEFPGVADDRQARRALRGIVSTGASLQLRDMVLDDPSLVGTTRSVWLVADDDIDQLYKGFVDPETDEANRRVNNEAIGWVRQLEEQDRVELKFNTILFTHGDSRDPELAGIWGAIVGSFWLMVVVLLLSVPLGVGAAVYLEEFAPKNNRWVDLIEVNVNNLAAVPSIVFGLLGLAVFLNLFGLPRSAPLAGGLTLTLMTLPTIVVATRAALRSVPPSIREGALGVGASKVQVVAHHVLPLALPGILTGTIIGMAQALGETAPLLMIGMQAFIVDVPSGPTSPATALPVQIFLWSDSPERAFTERTSAAIMVLLGFLILMNGLAVYLRQRFQVRW